MKKILALAAAVTLGFSSLVSAQSGIAESVLENSRPFTIFNQTDTTPAVIIQYLGTGVGTIDTDSGDIDFAVDSLEDESLTSAFDDLHSACGVDNTTYTTFDIAANSACNTLGKFVDGVNADANWRAVIVGGLRSTTIANADFVDLAGPVSIGATKGVELNWDTSADEKGYAAVFPWSGNLDKDDISPFLEPDGTLRTFAIDGSRVYVTRIVTTITGETGKIEVYSVSLANDTETKIWEYVGGATTVQDTEEFDVPLVSSRDEYLVIVLSENATGTITAAEVGVIGVVEKF